MENPGHIDYQIPDSIIKRRFRPNLLFSEQGCSDQEVRIFNLAINLIKSKIAFFKTEKLETAIVFYASAQLVNNAIATPEYSQVNIDLEFLRLLDQVTDCMEDFSTKKTENPLFDILVDKFLFHSCVRKGNYDLLGKLQPLPNTYRIGDRGQMYALMQSVFIICHELDHLKYLKFPEEFEEMKSNLFKNSEEMVKLFAKNLLNYSYLIRRATIFGTTIEAHRFVGFEDMLNADQGVLSEIICDEIAFAFAFSFGREVKMRIDAITSSLLSIEFTQALIDLTEQLIDFHDFDGNVDSLNLDKLFNLSLREVGFNSFLASWLLANSEEKAHPPILNLIDRQITNKNQLTILFIKKILARIIELRDKCSFSDNTNHREMIKKWGFKHDRISYMTTDLSILNGLRSKTASE